MRCVGWWSDRRGLVDADEQDHAYDTLPLILQLDPQQQLDPSMPTTPLIDSTLNLVHALVNEDTDNLERVSRWIRVLTCCRIAVPWELLDDLVTRHVADAGEGPAGNLAVKIDLVAALSYNTPRSDRKVIVELTGRLVMSYVKEARVMLARTLPTAEE